MNKFMKKTLSGIMAATMLTSLIGCSKAAAPASTENTSKDDKVTVNVWHQWANDTNDLKKIYDSAVVKYQQDNKNVVIKTDTLDTEAYKTKINTAFASNSAAVDVFFYWGAGKARKLAESGKLLAIDEYVKDGTLDKIMPGSTTAFTFDGKLYSLPMFSWVMSLYCNKEIFDANGVKIPTNYEEWVDACKKLSAKGVLPLVVGAKDGWNAAFIYEALALREVGAEKENALLSGKVGFEDPGFAEAAKKLQELRVAGAFGKSTLATSHDEADSAFLGGKAAMRVMGSWFAGAVYTNKDSKVQDKVVAAKIPMVTGKGNENEFAGGFVDSFWVNANTKNKEESVKFQKYINEAMAKGAAENSLGFTGWKSDFDKSKLNPLTVQIAEQVKSSKGSVLAWDTSLDEAPTAAHLEAVQLMFTDKGNVDGFVKSHVEALKK